MTCSGCSFGQKTITAFEERKRLQDKLKGLQNAKPNAVDAAKVAEAQRFLGVLRETFVAAAAPGVLGQGGGGQCRDGGGCGCERRQSDRT